MIDKIICMLQDQVNSFVVSATSFVLGMVLNPVKTFYIGGPVLEHWITTILQWIAFLVAIIAGIYTIYKGHKYKKNGKKNIDSDSNPGFCL